MGYCQKVNFSNILTGSFEKVRRDLTLQFYTKNSYGVYSTTVKFQCQISSYFLKRLCSKLKISPRNNYITPCICIYQVSPPKRPTPFFQIPIEKIVQQRYKSHQKHLNTIGNDFQNENENSKKFHIFWVSEKIRILSRFFVLKIRAKF